MFGRKNSGSFNFERSSSDLGRSPSKQGLVSKTVESTEKTFDMANKSEDVEMFDAQQFETPEPPQNDSNGSNSNLKPKSILRTKKVTSVPSSASTCCPAVMPSSPAPEAASSPHENINRKGKKPRPCRHRSDLKDFKRESNKN